VGVAALVALLTLCAGVPSSQILPYSREAEHREHRVFRRYS